MKSKEHIFLYAFVVCLLIFVFGFNVTIPSSLQWLDLSRSFLSGSLHFLESPRILTDSTLFEGNRYWPFGPLPSVLLMPFIWIGDLLNIPLAQGHFQFVLTVLIFFVATRLAERVGYSHSDSLWWAMAFTFASPLIWIIINPGWGYFPYEFSVLLSLLALYEYVGKKRWPLIGFLSALVFLTRPTAGLFLLFFVFRIFSDKKTDRIRNLFIFSVPVIIAILLFGAYNYVRFHNPLEQGYAAQTVSMESLYKARSYGLISPVHIPGNVYRFLFAAPEPIYKDGVSHVLAPPYIKADPWGMSFLFISPYLILLFFLSYKGGESKQLLGVSFMILLVAFLYYGIGVAQIGYRYALDCFPLIYLLLIKNYPDRFSRHLSTSLKGLILLAVFLDFFFVVSFSL